MIDIVLQTYQDHAAVTLRIWDLAGDVRDVQGSQIGPHLFRFQASPSAPDTSNVLLKFWFPGESPEWENDAYVRRIPVSNAAALWVSERSARVLTQDPGPALPSGTKVTLGVLTAKRFADGSLFAWDPGSNQRKLFPLSRRDASRNLSEFEVTLEPWMVAGFHFKLVSKDGAYEPEEANRIWRPVDGVCVFLKSGQVEVRPQLPVARTVPITVIVPTALTQQASLTLRDNVDDYHEDLPLSSCRVIDAAFTAVTFIASLFPDALYLATPKTTGYCPQWELPLRITAAAPTSLCTLLGVAEWYSSVPARSAKVDLVIHANPSTCFGDSIEVGWHLGFPRRSRDEVSTPTSGTAHATKTAAGTWKAALDLFENVPHALDVLVDTAGVTESRADRLEYSQRMMRAHAGGPITLHTVDGLTGVSSSAPSNALFADVSAATRKQLMKAAFSPAIVEAQVFESHEMPHGATWLNDEVWFVLFAPHAQAVSVLLLDRASSSAQGRAVVTRAMSLTSDLRYWSCRVPKNELSQPAHVEYRYLLDATTEVLDPASRESTDAPYVWPEPGEGPQDAWSVVVDRAAVAAEVAKSTFVTPWWHEFMIYEMHVRRFTARNTSAAGPFVPFRQIAAELSTGRYLDRLPVTALELLPVNEFPKYISWGYNSSLYFAVESSYGGPAEFAALVRSAHSAGKAVVLDVVYNHLTDSPMQATAPDVFVDGRTQWGDMVNYDHPVCIEFFRQATVYLWDTFAVDGFRFDATEAIVNGHVDNGYIIRDGRVGSGQGWEFLGALRAALWRAAAACGRRRPYLMAENKPNNWGMDQGVVDGQWDFDFGGKLGEVARCEGDAVNDLWGPLATQRSSHETVRFEETHDSVSTQDPKEKRIACRPPFGAGIRMAKACGAVALMAKGVPMFFMGAEAAETQPFYFDVPKSLGVGVLPLDTYEDLGTENHRVLTWFRDLLGLRGNWANGLAANDIPYVGKGHRTIAFTRNDGHFFVIATFGTEDRRQDTGWLGLPPAATYKEVFNSTWPAYRVGGDTPAYNGGYDARLMSGAVVNLPEIGVVILERTS